MTKKSEMKSGLTTTSTRYDADAIPVNETGVLDGITVNGKPVEVWYHVDPKSGNVRSVDVIHTGNAGQKYVENKPKPEAGNATITNYGGPAIRVHGKTKNSVKYDAGHFSDSVNGPNSMPRKIATVKLENATIKCAGKKRITLDGTWTIMAMVKYDHKRNDGRVYRRIVIKRGADVSVKTINA